MIYFRLIQTLGSVGTTAQAYLRVPIGVALGVLFLGERLSTTAWIGLGCVVIGVAAMTIPARKAADTASRKAGKPYRMMKPATLLRSGIGGILHVKRGAFGARVPTTRAGNAA